MNERMDASQIYGLEGPLRILHLAKFFPPERGGMETYVRDLALEQAADGHEVLVLAHAGQLAAGKESVAPSCRVERCKVWGKAGGYAPLAPSLPFVLRGLMRSFKPHVVHAHCPNPAALWCLLPGMLTPSSLFVLHWHSDVIFPADKMPPRALVALWRRLERAVLRRADLICATSRPYLDSSVFLRPWQAKCRVVPMRINPLPPPIPENMRHPAVDFLRGPVEQNAFSVLAVGRLAHYKGFDLLLRAVAQVPAARCCIVGTGEEEATLRRLVDELCLNERVLLAGEVEEQVLTACYRACDVFCLPSTMRSEAFGIVLLEALREGKWCIAADVPGSGMGTVVHHGENGWLVQPGDVEELAAAFNAFQAKVPLERPQKERAQCPAAKTALPTACPLMLRSQNDSVLKKRNTDHSSNFANVTRGKSRKALRLLPACAQHIRSMLGRANSFLPVQKWGERLFLYPALPHIVRRKSYPDGPMLLAGFFSSIHGIGQAARYELLHRQKNGEDIIGIDLSPAFGICDIPPPQGLCNLDDAPTNGPLLLHCNAPEAGRALRFLGQSLTENRPIIGYWAWELEHPPHTWHLAYPYFDEVWVPSRHSSLAFADAPLPVRVKAHPVAAVQDGGHSLEALGFPASCRGRQLFLCMADARSSLIRKNIRGTIQAFALALGNKDSAALLVKMHHALHTDKEYAAIWNIAQTCNNIHIVERSFTPCERNSLLHRCDTVISLHRAEGYGLLLAEALALGKGLIATAYSGNMEFMTPENSTLLPFTMVPVTSDTAIYAQYPHAVWAEPDMPSAVEALRNHVPPREGAHAS